MHLLLSSLAAGSTSDAISELQESFKVKFEANPKDVKEFIQINVTATRCERQLYIKGLHCVLVKPF